MLSCFLLFVFCYKAENTHAFGRELLHYRISSVSRNRWTPTQAQAQAQTQMSTSKLQLKTKLRPKRSVLLNLSNSNTGRSVSNHELEKKLLRKQTIKRILDASFLVTGTTIRGGFLALPSVAIPSGFYPSASVFRSLELLFGAIIYSRRMHQSV